MYESGGLPDTPRAVLSNRGAVAGRARDNMHVEPRGERLGWQLR